MKRTNLRGYIISAAIALSIGLGTMRLAIAEPDAPASATSSDQLELLGTFRRFEQIMFDAMVTGDPSAFAEVLYNDPTAVIVPEAQALAVKHRITVNDILTRVGTRGPIGGPTGQLSASIAEIVEYNSHADAWQAAKAQAARDGRRPTIQDLPPGLMPTERKQAAEWVDIDVFIHDAVIQGDTASAIFSFGTEKKEGTLIYLTFSRVNGQWYITSMSSSGDA